MKSLNLKNILTLFVCVYFSLAAVAQDEGSETVIKAIPRKALKKLNTNDYSETVLSSEYSNYGSYQPIFMPKAGRLQFKAGLVSLTDDKYYSSGGANIGLMFHFNESFGFGLKSQFLSSSLKAQAKNIQDIQSLNVEQVPTIKKTVDAQLYYTPFYGKWAFTDDDIVHFEFYLSAGGAQVTDQFDENKSATAASFGQLIALTPSSSIDVNFQWLFYNAKNILNTEVSTQSMLLSVSYGFLWPQADKVGQ